MAEDYNGKGREVLAESTAGRARIAYLFRRFCGPLTFRFVERATQFGTDFVRPCEITQNKVHFPSDYCRVFAGGHAVGCSACASGDFS